MNKDIEYEKNNIGYDYQYTIDDGIKCKNYEMCNTILPKWWFDCKNSYLCTNCDMMFGTWKNKKAGVYKTGKGELPIKDNLECPICLDIKRGISQPNCDHTLCIDCFKRCYYGDESRDGEPQFPYSKEIENEYDEDIYLKNPKWDKDYPLIKKYNEEWNKWDDNKQQKFNDEENLRNCPICRK